MADFVTLSCPSCGGKLQVTPDLDRFACAYCGHEHVVRRGGGIVSLSPVVEGLQQVRAGVDRTASELAIRRLKDEIPELQRQHPEVVEGLRRQRLDDLEAVERYRSEETALVEGRLPPAPVEPGLFSIGTQIGGVLTVFGLLMLLLLISPGTNRSIDFLGIPLLVFGSMSLYSGRRHDRAMLEEYAARREEYRIQHAQFVSWAAAASAQIGAETAARTAEIDNQLAARTSELDAQIAAKIAELERHQRLVSGE